MANWKVTIKEILVRVVEVKAKDKIDAEDFVRFAYRNGEIILESDDFNDVEITAEEVRNP